ncbi:MAG: DUF370 domain-containing protein [Lachnospiraceae bacterium]|nr:DUF370 domain-containing protein [Lachnospiraceae bacterium]
MNLINIGYGNIVNLDRMIAIVNPDSAPAKRMVRKAKDEGVSIDGTHGRKAKSVIIMENSQVVLSALTPDTLLQRVKAGIAGESDA